MILQALQQPRFIGSEVLKALLKATWPVKSKAAIKLCFSLPQSPLKHPYHTELATGSSYLGNGKAHHRGIAFCSFIKDLGGDQRGKCQLIGVSLFPRHGWARRGSHFPTHVILGPNLGNGLVRRKDSEMTQFTSLNLLKEVFVPICGFIFIKQRVFLWNT